MRLRFLPRFLSPDPRPGETPRAHIERVALSRVHPVWVIVRVLAAYAVDQQERIAALERRVAELETAR